MMNFLELVRQRRSVRHYQKSPVPRELIDRCLEAARLAPSACNAQPWYFIVLDDPEIRLRVCEAAFSGIYSSNRFAAEAPVLIVVVTDQRSYKVKVGGFFRKIQYSLIDLGIAGEHFILQAAELGLGTCWLGWFNRRAVRKALNLPKATTIDILFSLGYPANPSGNPRLRRPLAEIRHYNFEK